MRVLFSVLLIGMFVFSPAVADAPFDFFDTERAKVKNAIIANWCKTTSASDGFGICLVATEDQMKPSKYGSMKSQVSWEKLRT